MRDLEKDRQLCRSLVESLEESEIPVHVKMLIKSQISDLATMTDLAIIRIKDLDRRSDNIAKYFQLLSNDSTIKWTPEIHALMSQIASLKAETGAAQ
jgi:hypothetical protein